MYTVNEDNNKKVSETEKNISIEIQIPCGVKKHGIKESILFVRIAYARMLFLTLIKLPDFSRCESVFHRYCESYAHERVSYFIHC